jgi:hypothetical protein
VKTRSIALAGTTLLLCATTAFSQDPPCKGRRRGDPNCAPPPASAPNQPAPPNQKAGEAVPKKLKYTLSLARTGEGDVLEFMAVDVSWTLSVDVVGNFGPNPVPEDVDICPAVMPPGQDLSSVCAHVAQASASKTYPGKLTVPAPPAGKQSPLRMVVLKRAPGVEDYGQRIAVGEGSVSMDVAARYEIAVSSFEVLTTRSTSSDTIWISLNGLIKADPPHFSDNPEACKTVGFTTWCLFNQSAGTVGDGLHAVANARVFPYDLVPERESDLRFSFDLDNHDHNPAQEIFVAVANGFSKAGMIVLSAYSAESGNQGGSVAAQLDTAMEAMHSSMAASCDGQVAADVVILTNKTIGNQTQFTLDNLTRGTGVYSGTAPEIYRNIDGDLRCDRRGGAYRVSYTITRTSWQAWGFKPTY